MEKRANTTHLPQRVATIPGTFAAALQQVVEMQTRGVIRDCCLIGSVAAMVYIEPQFTKDVDVVILVDNDAEWLAVLAEARKLGPEIGHAGVELGGVHVEIWPSSGFPLYEAALASAQPVDVGGVSFKVASAEVLIVLALDAWRPQDQARVQLLLPYADLDGVNALVQRYKPELASRLTELTQRSDPDATPTEWQSRFYNAKRGYHAAKSQMTFAQKLGELDELARLGARKKDMDVDLMRQLLDEAIRQPVFLHDLAINGSDLMALGIPEGPEVGRVLKELNELVLDNPELNNRDSLLAVVPYVFPQDNR